MINIIAAVSQNGVIGINNEIPWNYSEDMQYFRQMTTGCIIVMGRNTFNSIGRALPNRENIVITSQPLTTNGIKCLPSIKAFFEREKTILREKKLDIWFIGGARIYDEAMQYADKIYLTITPDVIEHPLAIRFPWINPQHFEVNSVIPFDDNPQLNHCVYDRIINPS